MATGQLDTVLRHLRRTAQAEDGPARADGELLERFIARRDEQAFATLVRRHGPMVLGVCRRLLRNETDAEDAFQATFLVLARKASSIRPRGMVGNWLYGVACNTARKARAASARRRAKESEAGTMPRSTAPNESWQQLQFLLDAELEALPDKYRVPIVLCDLEGKTRKEAARHLRWAEGTVASRLARARVLLARRLARHGLTLSGGALAALLAHGEASACVPVALLSSTVKAALTSTAGATVTTASISARVAVLTESVVRSMFVAKLKHASAAALVLTLITTCALLLVPPALSHSPFLTVAAEAQAGSPDQPPPSAGTVLAQVNSKDQPAQQAGGKGKWKSCIILWMDGGPSQIDTFDPKPEAPAEIRGQFKALDTAVKGIQISEHLPKLGKLMNHLVLIRTLTHKEGDHQRATYLMRTGYPVGGQTDYPSLGCVLAKELGDNRPDLPRYFNIAPVMIHGPKGFGPGCLGPQYAPLLIGDRLLGFMNAGPDDAFKLPAAGAFEKLAKGKGETHRKAVEKAFDLKSEKAAVRDAYGPTLFGQGCLLARRLVEAGVPVVEVTLPGWDTHADNFTAVKQLSGELDAAWASLLSDLKERKLLDSTLIVCMGEFGRTPKINAQLGRDHWPFAFSVVLAGGGIKGGQAVGKTSKDGLKVDQRPVKPSELHATVYQALGIDHTRQYQSNTGQKVRLVEVGANPLNDLLP